jgi:hypothetical protein
MADYTVVVNFNDGVNNYDLPHIFKISDPKEGIKATVIEGTRGDGVIVIPGGKKSQEITIQGRLFDNDGYADLSTLIAEMKTKVTTSQATLTLKYWNGSTWVNNWAYTVRRLDEIDFPESLRTFEQEYSVRFLVIAY